MHTHCCCSPTAVEAVGNDDDVSAFEACCSPVAVGAVGEDDVNFSLPVDLPVLVTMM